MITLWSLQNDRSDKLLKGRNDACILACVQWFLDLRVRYTDTLFPNVLTRDGHCYTELHESFLILIQKTANYYFTFFNHSNWCACHMLHIQANDLSFLQLRHPAPQCTEALVDTEMPSPPNNPIQHQSTDGPRLATILEFDSDMTGNILWHFMTNMICFVAVYYDETNDDSWLERFFEMASMRFTKG